jgi:hypothetical protein
VDDARIDGDRTPVARPVHAVDLGESQVLYDATTGRAHVLNAEAARIWAMLDGATSIDVLAATLASDTGAASEVVARDVRSSIERFRAEGLLDPPAGPSAHESGSVADGADWPEASTTDGRRATVALLDRTVDIATRSDRVADALAWWSEPLRSREPAAAVYDASVVVDEATIRLLPAHLNRLAARSDALVTLHAAGVVVGDRVVVLAGAPGAGKSTLATALVAHGYGYLSDEVVGLALAGGGVAGYPKRITLERGSWELFPSLEQRASRAVHPDLDPTRVRWIDPRALQPSALAWCGAPLELGLVVVPHYAPDQDVSITRLDPVEAMTVLLGNAFNLASSGERALRALRDVALEVPCYRLVHSDVHLAEACVRERVRERGFV